MMNVAFWGFESGFEKIVAETTVAGMDEVSEELAILEDGGAVITRFEVKLPAHAKVPVRPRSARI